MVYGNETYKYAFGLQIPQFPNSFACLEMKYSCGVFPVPFHFEQRALAGDEIGCVSLLPTLFPWWPVTLPLARNL